MARDEARYPDGDKFDPERFLDSEGRLIDDNPFDFAFGFGRRKCAGMSLHPKQKSLAHHCRVQAVTLRMRLSGVPL